MVSGSELRGAPSSPPSEQLIPFPSWPRWQVQGQGADADPLVVVQQDDLNWAGYVVVIALAVFGWRIRSQRRSLFILACAVFLCLLALALILPPHLFRVIAGPSIVGLLICLAVLIFERALPLRTVANAVARRLPSLLLG